METETQRPKLCEEERVDVFNNRCVVEGEEEEHIKASLAVTL